MARQNINLGTNANDGTGDKLRDAMEKVNNNLIELYSRTGGDQTQTGTSITASGNVLGIAGDMTITTNNVGNVSITAPTYFTQNVFASGNLSIGTTSIEPDISLLIEGNLKIKGNTNVGDDPNLDRLILNSMIRGTIIPEFDNTYDLGTVSLRYRNLNIANNISTTNFFSPNANIVGGRINSTLIGDATPAEGRFSTLRVNDDVFIGDLLVRNNQISSGAVNGDIEFRPNGTGNVYVSTKLIVGAGSTPMVNPVLQATGNADNFTQIGVQNKSGGKFACSDIVVFTNAGSDFFDFVDIGQNNTGWDGSLQYLYFDKTSEANTWIIGSTLVQYDLDGSTILARGQIDEIFTNPANEDELRVRVCNIFEGSTGLFEQGSTHGAVINESDFSFAIPKDHVIETIVSTGAETYNLGTHTLNNSTAKAAFGPTIALAGDSVEVKVNEVKQKPGIDYTINFNKILFYKIPPIGSTITIRQFPDANYPYTVGQSGDSYMYNNGSKLSIGTMTGHDLLFHVNGIRYTAEAGRIKGPTKNWIIGSGVTNKDGFTDTGEKLQVHGAIKSHFVKGAVEQLSPIDNITIVPNKSIYSYNPAISITLILVKNNTTAGQNTIIRNRSGDKTIEVIDSETGNTLTIITGGEARMFACDNSGWFMVS